MYNKFKLFLTMVIIITYNPSSYSQHSSGYYESKYDVKSTKTRHIEDDGYVWYELYESSSGYGIENNEGDIILYPKYGPVRYEKDAKTFIVNSDGNDYEGVLSKSGSWIISFDRQYESIYYVITHYYVKKNGFKGICDEDGREIFAPNKYDDVYGPYFKEDGKRYFLIEEKNDLKGICDEDGREIIAPKYDLVIGPYFKEDGKRYFHIKKNGFEGICDEDGREIIAPNKYDNVFGPYFKEDGKRYFRIEKNGLNGICDEDGREIIAPKYDDYIDVQFKDGKRYFIIEKNGLRSYCDEDGRVTKTETVDVVSVSNGRSTTVSSSNSTSSTSSEKLLYEGDYTISNQSYNTGAGQYTNAIGSGIDIHVRVYKDYIMIDGTKCNYASTSGDWRIYAGVAWNNSKEYYKVNFKNFEMSKFTDILNPFTGMFDTFTTSIVKGKVYFNVNNNSNSNNYNTGQSSTQTKSSGNVNQETTRYVDKTCHGCHNSGKCNTCNGKGWIERLGVKGTMDCPNCTNGRCSICGGSGKVRGLR